MIRSILTLKLKVTDRYLLMLQLRSRTSVYVQKIRYNAIVFISHHHGHGITHIRYPNHQTPRTVTGYPSLRTHKAKYSPHFVYAPLDDILEVWSSPNEEHTGTS